MSKPKAVLISDVHYSLPTLELADKAMRLAIAKANELDVPLIVAGDLHDTKANMRAECVNAMVETFNLARDANTEGQWDQRKAFVLVGNHDKINQKSENNALNFLNELCYVIDKPQFTNLITLKGCSLEFIPYQHNADDFRTIVRKLDKKSTIICHQGLTSSNSGEYIQDKSAINPEDVSGFRVISGHYHYRQTKQLPDVGVWDYIGNPYSLNYGEANDPPKGFQILMDDGSLEFVPTNLRKHVVINVVASTGDVIASSSDIKEGDLIWVKLEGSSHHIAVWPKERIAKGLNITQPFRLTTTAIDSTTPMPQTTREVPQDELLDSIIDSLTDADSSRKTRLKGLWKDLVAKE